jgi:hypothetical protein
MDLNHVKSLKEENIILVIFAVAFVVRVLIWWMIPVDWDWDSYHHWQISYFTLKIGFIHHRLWDLNGCEYYWGMIPHIFQAIILGALNTTSIIPYRILNILLGSVNAILVYKIGSRFYSKKNGLFAGLLFAVFPVSMIFDVLAMQDTIALTFLLISLFIIKQKPFWAGLSLALAGQSRIELMLVGIMIMSGYILRERLHTNSLPYILGWMLGTGIFSFFLFTQTGNPIYSLYWSLHNVFGGWIKGNEQKAFIDLAINWIIQKLRIWPGKLSSLVILILGITTISFYPYMSVKRLVRYQPIIYFLTTASILTPIFITYIGSNTFNLLIMLRMVNPIVALGAPQLIYLLDRFGNTVSQPRAISLFKAVILTLTICSSVYFVPAYSSYQSFQTDAFHSAELLASYYVNGTIVCDLPTMNYWLIHHSVVYTDSLISNHYSPDYYGITDPIAYANWLYRNNVTLWVYYDQQSEPVWNVISLNYPKLFVPLDHGPYARIYLVNQTLLEILVNQGDT